MLLINTCDQKFDKLMSDSNISIIKNGYTYQLLLNKNLAMEFTDNDLEFVVNVQYKKSINDYMLSSELKPFELIKLIEKVLELKLRMLKDSQLYHIINKTVFKEPEYLRRLKFVYLTLKEII